MRMGKRNHSTVISACRRIEMAVLRNEALVWTSAVGERTEEAAELVQRLEEHGRAMNYEPVVAFITVGLTRS
jgi:hypothetical protein